MKKFIASLTLAGIAFALALTPVSAKINYGVAPAAPPAPTNSSSTADTVKSNIVKNKTVKNKTVDLACVAAAVAKREAAIDAAFSTFATAAQAALTARADALKAAWALTDKTARRTAIKAAWNAYSSALKSARKALNTARHSAWTGFREDAKACGPGATSDEPASEGSDASL